MSTTRKKNNIFKVILSGVTAAVIIAASAGCGTVDLTMGKNNKNSSDNSVVEVIMPAQTTTTVTTTAVTTEVPLPVKSYNDAVAYFAVLMNDYAKKLGAKNTHFTVPDGYHDDEHYTTAEDMLKFAIAATQSQTICDITCQPLAIVYDEQGNVHSWDNGNKLLTDTTIPYEVYGMKTGFTDEAGFCFIGYAGMNGKKILTLVYGGEVENRYADTKKLMDLGFDIYDENHDYYTVEE